MKMIFLVSAVNNNRFEWSCSKEFYRYNKFSTATYTREYLQHYKICFFLADISVPKNS